MAPKHHNILTIPKSEGEVAPNNATAAVAHKFRDFFLLALKTAPEAFASSYETAKERDIQHTYVRLSNPKAVQFVALEGDIQDASALPPKVRIEILPMAKWLGMIVLLGPEEESSETPSAKVDPFSRMTAQTMPAASVHVWDSTQPKTLHYHLNGMFVAPEARGNGLGIALIDCALESAMSQARAMGAEVEFSIAVNEENISARKLYEKVGFRYVGRETYTQQPRMAAGEMKAYERVAMHMQMTRR